MKKLLKALLGKISCAVLGLMLPALLHAQAIKIDGSSTVYPISKKAADDFQKLIHGSNKLSSRAPELAVALKIFALNRHKN